MVPPHCPAQFHFQWDSVSATSASVPAEHPFSTALLQLPFVAGVAVHAALVALPHVPAAHANVADPVRQEAVFPKVTLEPDWVALAVSEQPLPHDSVVPEHCGFAFSHWAVVPPHCPAQFHFQWDSVSATSASVPAEQPFSTALLQLPFVAGVTVHEAPVALPHVPAAHANVADPVRQEAVFPKVTLEPDWVSLAVFEQPLPHDSAVPEHRGFSG